MARGEHERVKNKPKSNAWTEFRCSACSEKFWVMNWRVAQLLKRRRSSPRYCSSFCRDNDKRHQWNREEIKKFILGCRIVDESKGCWFFVGSRDKRLCRNRPVITVAGKTFRVAKVALWAFKKDRRALRRGRKHNACHTCDTPACINPDHLFYGTPKSNAQDKIFKRRDANSQKTHCPHGHSYSGNNIGFLNEEHTRRRCLTCHRERERMRRRAS